MQKNKLLVEGGNPISGTIQPSGNSNSAVASIVASLLTDQQVTLQNVPDTDRIRRLLSVVKDLGADISQDLDHTVSIRLSRTKTITVDREAIRASWYSFLLLAPILIREGRVQLELDFPVARISTHLLMLKDLGCDVSVERKRVEIKLHTLKPQNIWLQETSVTATALAMMLASK